MLHISLSFSLSTYAYNLQPQPRPQLVDEVGRGRQGMPRHETNVGRSTFRLAKRKNMDQRC